MRVCAGIGRQQSEVVRERTEDYVRWEKQHRGLCRHEYWVGVPSQRTVAEVYNETTFRLEPAKIKVPGPSRQRIRLAGVPDQLQENFGPGTAIWNAAIWTLDLYRLISLLCDC